MTNPSQLKPNPVTHKAHRKQVFWQITFPLILGIFVILGLAAWAIVAAIQGGNVSQPADASLIFLLLPTMVFALIPLAILAGLAYGVIVLNNTLPGYLRKAQEAMMMVRDEVRKGADKLVAPLISFKSRMAAFEVLKRKR